MQRKTILALALASLLTFPCAATAANGGRITAATDVDYTPVHHDYHFDKGVYDRRLYYGFRLWHRLPPTG